MQRACLGLALFAWVTASAFASTARAQAPAGAVLEWSAPAGCGSREAVAAEVGRLLGQPLSEAPATRVHAAVRRHGDELQLEVRLVRDGHTTSRVIDGPTCEALVRAGALVIALAIDPEAVERRRSELDPPAPDEAALAEPDMVDPPETATEGSSPTETSAEEPSADPDDAPSREPAPARDARGPTIRRDAAAVNDGDEPDGDERDRELRSPIVPVSDRAPIRSQPEPDLGEDATMGRGLRFLVSAMPSLSIGPLPSVAPSIGVSIGVGIGPVELSLAGFVAPEQGAGLGDESDAGGQIGLALGRIRGCASLEPVGEWLELLPCVALEVGGMWARGENVPIVRHESTPWVGAAAGLEARLWLVDAFAIGVFAELVVPILRPRFILTLEEGTHEIHQPLEAGAFLGLSATLRVH